MPAGTAAITSRSAAQPSAPNSSKKAALGLYGDGQIGGRLDQAQAEVAGGVGGRRGQIGRVRIEPDAQQRVARGRGFRGGRRSWSFDAPFNCAVPSEAGAHRMPLVGRCAEVAARARTGEKLAISEGIRAAQDDPAHPAADLATFERGPAAAGVMFGAANLVLGVLVDLDPGVRLLGQIEDAPWVVDHAADHVVQRQSALTHRSQQQRQRGFQPGEAGRRVVAVLFLRGVRRVVGREAVDDVEVIPQRLLVGRGWRAAGRTSLRPKPSAAMSSWRQEQVVRRHLARDLEPGFLGAADQQDFLAQRDVGDVDRAVEQLRPSG